MLCRKILCNPISRISFCVFRFIHYNHIRIFRNAKTVDEQRNATFMRRPSFDISSIKLKTLLSLIRHSYKRCMIVNYDSRVVLPMGDFSVNRTIYDHRVLIRLATDVQSY